MTDAFDTLADHTSPQVTPRAAFAAELRHRLEAALEAPMRASDGSVAVEEDAGYLFYFTLPAADPDRAARFYRSLFDWQLQGGSEGFHVDGVYPPMGLASNDSTTPEIWIEVSNIAQAVERVRELGGQADEPVHYDSGWNAECRDDQGVAFNIIVPAAHYRHGQARSTEPGELFYWSLPAPDAERSKAFYRDLFGWEYGDPGEAGGLHIDNKLPDGGLGGGRAGSHADLFFRVYDLDAAMAKVEALGGSAEPAGEGPEGRHAVCTDDQGTPFGLSEPAAR
jgi:predicted enzyme related to lactoylglutathione lyase